MNSAPDPALLIVGYGNTIRGDDAAGPLAARELHKRGFTAIVAQQLTPEFAEPLSQANHAIFIDSDASLAPGVIRATIVQPALEPALSGILEHHATPAALLLLSRQIYGRAPHACLIGIGPESYDLGRPLSSPAAKAICAIVLHLAASLRQIHLRPPNLFPPLKPLADP